MPVKWSNTSTLSARDFTCGYCGREVASNVGYFGKWEESPRSGTAYIVICSRCNFPTFFAPGGGVIPGPKAGERVEHLPPEVGELWEQAQGCMSINAYTAAALLGRKLLMHIAVEQGAKTGETFAAYVSYLADKGIVTAAMTDWVDEIRELGNEANHEIVLMTKEQAEELLTFVGMLLKVVYEYPEKGRRSVQKRGGSS